jgi:integrase
VTERRLIVIMRRMRRKLSPKLVEHIKALGPKRLDVWDTVLQCFGVRISPSGRKTWFVVARVDGRQKRITIGTYPAVSLAEARTEARKIIRDAQLGVLSRAPEAPALTLGDTVPLFIQLYAKPKNRGWKESERLLDKFQDLFGKPLTQIVRSDVVRVLDEIVASGTPYRANRALAALKKLMNWALDRGMIEVNPIAGLKPPHKERSRELVLSDAALASLMRAADAEGYPFGDALKLLVLTGQRRSEVAEMRWSEIDLERAVWTVPPARSKNGQAHQVPLSAPTVRLLQSLPRFLASDWVFTTTGRAPISGFGRMKRRLHDAAGMPDWRIHDIRRTMASGMARIGVEPHVIEKVLNHKSGIISGVAAVYNRYGYEKEKRAALVHWSAFLLNLRSDVGCQADYDVSIGKHG